MTRQVREWEYHDAPMYLVGVVTGDAQRIVLETADGQFADSRFKQLIDEGQYPWLYVVHRIVGTYDDGQIDDAAPVAQETV